MGRRCTNCKRSFAKVDSAPMLFDASWRKLAHRRETLCAECFFERAEARGIRVTLADLRPCLFNCFHAPHDWFDLFAAGAPAELVADWQRWLKAEKGVKDDNQ